MKNIIYCFTGTGNSLHTANAIAAALPDCTVVSVSAKELVLPDASTERIGFVYPVYAGGLPLIDTKDSNPLTIAIEEINRGLITYSREEDLEVEGN